MKQGIKNLFSNKTARILLIAGAALILLILCWAVFGKADAQSDANGYTPTSSETRLSAILSQIDGAGTVTASITEEEGVPVSAVVFFDGEDGILIRLRLTQVAAASLNVAENRILVCPAGK